MNNRHRFAVIAGAVLLAAIVGTIAYNAGISHGIAQSGKIVAPPPGTYPYPYYGWHGHGPWGFGWIFFLLFFFFFARMLFWGGRYRRGCYPHEHEHAKTEVK